MKWKKEHLILLVLIAALAAYLIVQKNGRTHYVLPSVAKLAAKDITKLVVKNKGVVITLARKGRGWVIEPQGYPAEEGTADRMAEDVGGLTLTALASEGGNEAIYELDPGRRIDVEAYNGDKPVREFGIGKATASGGHTFVQLAGNAGIFHADRGLRRTFDKTVPELRDKTVMRVKGEVTSLTLAKGGKTLVIRRTPAAAAGKKGPASQWMLSGKKRANDARVDGLVNAVSDVMCGDFLDGKTKKDFRSPVYTVSITAGKTYTLSIYREKDKTFAGISSESPYPFTLPGWKATDIMKDFGSLVAPKK
jgi:Domain of unknown function (DUF4340)